jgi:hypothetical protein
MGPIGRGIKVLLGKEKKCVDFNFIWLFSPASFGEFDTKVEGMMNMSARFLLEMDNRGLQ